MPKARYGPELGPEQLKALTHPLRVRLLRALRADGPATASALAKRFGETSGATSYHLRQLERHGFIEEDPESGDGRDRWWRPAFRGHSVDPARYVDDPETFEVVSAYQANVVQGYAEVATEYVEEQARGEWSREWVEAAELSDFVLRLTPAQLKRLKERLFAAVRAFQDYDSPGAEKVSVTLFAFPHRTYGGEAE